MPSITCTTIFQNGLEVLFPPEWVDGQFKWEFKEDIDITYFDLLKHLSQICTDKEMFFADKANSELGVRPGILVLVDDVDLELVLESEGIPDESTGTITNNFPLTNGSTILFISTLHGG